MVKEVVPCVDGKSQERNPFIGLTGTRGGFRGIVSTARIEADSVSYGKSSGWGIPNKIRNDGRFANLYRSPPPIVTERVSVVFLGSDMLTHALDVHVLVELLE